MKNEIKKCSLPYHVKSAIMERKEEKIGMLENAISCLKYIADNIGFDEFNIKDLKDFGGRIETGKGGKWVSYFNRKDIETLLTYNFVEITNSESYQLTDEGLKYVELYIIHFRIFD